MISCEFVGFCLIFSQCVLSNSVSVFSVFAWWIRDCKLNSLQKFASECRFHQMEWITVEMIDAHKFTTTTKTKKFDKPTAEHLIHRSQWSSAKPQFYMRFKSICSFIFKYYFWFNQKTKLSKTNGRKGWSTSWWSVVGICHKRSLILWTNMAWILI